MPFPDICVEDRMACPNERPTLLVYQCTCATKTVEIRDRLTGCAIDLTDKVVNLVYNDVLGARRFEKIIEAVIITPEDGIVEIHFTEEDTSDQGLWLGEFQISAANPAEGDCVELDKLPCYVEIAGSVQDMLTKSVLPITIGEVRLAIRDKCRLDNFLLDHVQFTDTEIAWAIRRPVEWWNETPPDLGVFSPATFPYRYNHLNGIVGELLTMVASLNEERNKLTYSAAGLSVGDKDKASAFASAGQALTQDFRRWALGKKKTLNMEQAFGRTSIRSFGNSYGKYSGNRGI